MKVIYEAASQGATLRVYHHGYIAIDHGPVGFGWQLYPEDLEPLIAALRESVSATHPEGAA